MKLRLGNSARRLMVLLSALVYLLGASGLLRVPTVSAASTFAYAYDAARTSAPSVDHETESLESAASRSGRVAMPRPVVLQYDVPVPLRVSRTSMATKPGGGAVTKPAGVPDDFVAVVANNGKGTVWRAPGTTTNAGTVRVMEPTAQYPNGYVRFYNNSGPGQPIGLDGKTGPNSHTHIPINPDGTYPLPKGWGA